jgi:hypothetical protein
MLFRVIKVCQHEMLFLKKKPPVRKISASFKQTNEEYPPMLPGMLNQISPHPEIVNSVRGLISLAG